MKALFFLLCLVCLFCTSGRGQDQEPYRLSSQISAQLASDTLPWKNQKAAWDYSYMGDYALALQTWDAQYPTMKREATAQDSALFTRYAPVKAKDYLLKQAARHQLFIINEAHHNPRHRVFTQSLLADLYRQGYRYLALEALFEPDSLLRPRGYPVLESGYYLREPQFGNLVREALRLGYTVVGYDVQDNGKTREIGQARNLQKILQQDPKAKILIHCGFDHVNEGASAAWEKAMAGRLKEFTGLDPFTVDQEGYSEASATRFEKPFFQLANAPFAAVYLHKDTKAPFAGTGTQRTVDAVVVHPRTKQVHRRPNWLWLENHRQPYQIPAATITVGFPCLALAFQLKDDEKAVPLEVVEFKSANQVLPLALPPGRYRVVLKNAQNQKQELTIQVK